MASVSFRNILGPDNMLKDGASYPEWLRKIKLILSQEGKLHALEQEAAPLIPPGQDAPAEEQASYDAKVKELNDVKCLMLGTMSPELHGQHEGMTAREIYQSLEGMFKVSDRQERYGCTTRLCRRMMPANGKVETHVQEFMKDVQRLKNLGFEIPQELITDLVLSSLPSTFSHFVINFNMSKMTATLPELLSMLTQTEKELHKSKGASTSQVLTVSQPKKRSRKGKEEKTPPKKKAKAKNWQNPTGNEKEAVCFQCGKKGHFKKNCTKKKA